MIRQFLFALPFILFPLTSVTASLPASAQDVVTCASNNGRVNRCRMDTRNGVRLLKSLSSVSCNGRWRIGDGYVEVTDGCRGQFAPDWDYSGNNNNNNSSNGRTVDCASNNGRANRCRMETRNGVRLVKTISTVSCNGRWRVGDGYVEVTDGCRGEFSSYNNSSGNNSYNGETINCESFNGKSQRCRINTRNGIRLVKTLSDTSCNGRWRVLDGYVEVTDGCRGQFTSNWGYNNNSNNNNNSRTIECASNNGRTERCRIETRNGVRLVKTLSNVSCNGRWRVGDGFIEVTDGCRGEFSSY